MKKIKQTITYRVPDWDYCNHIVNGTLGKASKDVCTFCVKLEKNRGYSCAIYNMPLVVEGGGLIQKTRGCIKACCGYKAEVVHEAEEQQQPVDPHLIIKATLDEYTKTMKDLVSQGYPTVIAEKVAREKLLGR